VVVEQNELQNECRSRETCSFGTPDAVVCKAARSASAVLAAVGRSVGIGARAGAGFRHAERGHHAGNARASRTEPRNTRSPATPAVHLRQARHHRSSRRSLHGACAPPSWAVCRAWVLEVATTPSPFPTRQPPLLATTPSRSLAASSLESSFQRSATREHSHSRPESGRRRRRKPPRAPPPGGLAGFGCASGAHVLRSREG
jgi:hypothetical protein